MMKVSPSIQNLTPLALSTHGVSTHQFKTSVAEDMNLTTSDKCQLESTISGFEAPLTIVITAMATE